jgi:hypothetical protein
MNLREELSFSPLSQSANVLIFAKMHKAFQEGKPAIQEVILDMMEMVHDPKTTEEEYDAAIDTLIEAFYG